MTKTLLSFAALLVLATARSCTAFRPLHLPRARPPSFKLWAAGETTIEFQSDETKYGRGEMHLSAVLDPDGGEVVVYQTGTWLVDGVEVGDGSQPEFEYGLVETIQLVWTHNCEHGVLRCLPLKLVDRESGGHQVLRIEEDECIEFGPEQLVAKLPLKWQDGASEVETPFKLNDDLAWCGVQPHLCCQDEALTTSRH